MAQRLFNTRFGKLCIVLYKGNIPSYVWSWHQFSACTEMVQVVETILDETMITSSNGNSHHMETFAALLGLLLLAFCAGNSPVTCEFPAQRPLTWSFDVFFNLPPNKWLSKQSWGWWFETPSCSLWHHCNEARARLSYHCSVVSGIYEFQLIKTSWNLNS